MSNRRVKHKRSKALVLMLLPALIFIGVIGWLMSSCTPTQQKPVKHQAPVTYKKRDDGLTFIPAVYKEESELINS